MKAVELIKRIVGPLASIGLLVAEPHTFPIQLAVLSEQLEAGNYEVDIGSLEKAIWTPSEPGHFRILTSEDDGAAFWRKFDSVERSRMEKSTHPLLLMVTPEAHEVMVDAAPNLMSTVGGNVVVADTEDQAVERFLNELTSQASPVAEAQYLFENIGIFVATEAVQIVDRIVKLYLEGQPRLSTGVGLLVATKSLENRLPSRGLLLQKLKSFLPEYLPEEPNNIALTRKVLNGFG
jgi:hypothetical protein